MEYPYVWRLGEEFTQFSVVRHNEKYYTCLIDHVSSNSTESGVGANWKTYWVLSSFNYLPKYNQGQEFFFPFFDIVLKSEIVTISGPPSGPTSGVIGTSYSFNGIGLSSYNHPLEYQFDWIGDGSDLSPWNSDTQSKIWAVYGNYDVRVRTRCILDPSVMSDWSSIHLISIAGVGPGHDIDCITDCTACSMPTHVPIISYTTQQMSCNGSQNISATGGGGGPYIWSIISGSGTLSKAQTDSNENNLYTAPSSNANCNNNPTIQVTDFCGNTDALQIAINCSASGLAAYKIKQPYSCLGPCVNGPFLCIACRTISDAYKCDGSQPTTNYSTCVGDISGADHGGSCPSLTGYICCNGGGGGICVSCAECYNQTGTGNCPAGNVGTTDTRSAAMKTGGCCPEVLL